MTKNNFILILFVLLLLGCEKIIDVDLNETNPVIVIEGSLSEKVNSAEVKISKTKSYFDDMPEQIISGATVTISDDKGRIFQLDEKQNGYYKHDSFFSITRLEYKLRVEYENEIYESVSRLNEPVDIDSLSVVYTDNSLFETGYNVYLYFHDPAETRNFYRLRIFVNNKPEDDSDDLILFEDKNTDGKFVEVRIYRKLYNVGDTIRYQLISLDEAAYNYLDAVSEIIGDGSAGTAAPANPNPNFTNGALGYFSAFSSTAKSIIIQKNGD